MTSQKERTIIRSVESPDSAWWGNAHSEPSTDHRYPPLEELIPTHISLRGEVPESLLAQQITISGGRCPCGLDDGVAVVPIDAALPTGTKIRRTTVREFAAAYADAG